ncbi:hypothetical protein WICPIJ_007012 [Wickerhamomyces pijperi]|uniref:Uncharacterized protein n=1 Tax=Wickerhamomyces pijperi TaxID=599730 RepID=A0A9P8Q2K6_WICPI|nr:hypothetical protein WICPIJ_007012 [Wickerhamomyces pijperi]
MLDLLPPDILQDIITFTHSSTRLPPQYVFSPQNPLVSELVSVSTLLREKLLPIYIKNYSLIRRREYEIKPPERSLLRAMLLNIKGCESFIRSLEIHTSQLSILDMFRGVKSLNVFGLMNDKSIDISHLRQLEHLSFLLPSSPSVDYNFFQITRLDLFIGTDIHSLTHLQLPLLLELNITTTELFSLLILNPFVSLLKRLDKLESMALLRKSSRVQSRDSAASIHHEHVDIEEFFDALSGMKLKKLTIDSAIIRNSFDAMCFTTELPGKSGVSNLEFEIVELSFVSLSPIEQRLTTLEFLISLPYTITSMKLIYGVQIELPYDTSWKFFADLFHPLINEEHGENNSIDRYSSLKSIGAVYSMMAWSLTEDQQLEEYQYEGMDILSYETRPGLFNPTYKKTTKANIKFGANSIQLIKDFKYVDEYDSRFWSIETISKDLKNFSKVSRSILWDQ